MLFVLSFPQLLFFLQIDFKVRMTYLTPLFNPSEEHENSSVETHPSQVYVNS